MPFTERQLKAINSRGESLLVSASAGSGKTTVLITRVINLILGKEETENGKRMGTYSPVSLDRMVICTFTRAAASDMRDKLQSALIEEQEKGSALASEQLELLPNAQISTIHSWCQHLLKDYFYAVGLDPAFELLDEREASVLLDETIDEIVNESVDSADEIFVQLYEIMMSKRSDSSLKRVLRSVYEFARSQADPDIYLSQTAFRGVDDSALVKDLYCAHLIKVLDKYREKFTKLFERCKAVNHTKHLKQLASIIEIINGNFTSIESARGKVETENELFSEECTNEVKAFKDELKKVKYKAFRDSQDPTNRKFVEQIVHLVQRIAERFADKKRKKARLDYGDLEHFTVKLLKSEVADDIRSRYDYVFVDEYQDVNPLQEQIILAFSSVLQFMVGDVKQSIYAFRMCDPTIFLNKQKNYGQAGFAQPIELNDNYRSHNEILDFANEVFCDIMTEDFGAIDYKNKAKLVAGLNKSGGAINLHSSVKSKAESKQGVYSVFDNADEEDASAVGAEVNAVVEKIHSLIVSGYNGETVDPSDIAVLYSARSERVGKIYEKLRRLGINATISDKIKFTSVKQISRLCQYLKFITDERDDIAFVASLKSPVGNLSDGELVKVRSFDVKEKWFVRLAKKYVSENNDEIANKLRQFFEYTNHCRDLSYTVSAGELIGKIVAEKAWFKYIFAQPDAKLNADTLNSFLQFASASACGDNLIDFVEYLSRENDDYERPPGENAVKIMTIHSSKGLEFKHVFLIDASHKFKGISDGSSLVCDETLGLCMKNFDTDKRQKTDSKLTVAVSIKRNFADREERMRLLYVALTRPKCTLDVFVTVDEKDELLTGVYTEKNPAFADSFLSWLRKSYHKHGFDIIKASGEEIDVSQVEKIAVANGETIDFSQTLRAYLDFSAPSKRVAVKKSATAVMLDSAEENGIKTEYITGESDDRAIDVGNAYHKAMELINFDAPFKSEWERIKDSFDIEKFVDKERLQTAHTVVGEFVKGKKCLKEQQFMYKNGDNMLIQGVIDLLVIDGKNFVVVDYKTSKAETIESGIYDSQLKVYCDACSKILKLKPLQPLVYSFSAGKFI